MSYKITALLKEKRTDEQILAYFANSYPPEVVRPFLDAAKAADGSRSPKRRRSKPKAKPKPEVTDGDSDLDL